MKLIELFESSVLLELADRPYEFDIKYRSDMYITYMFRTNQDLLYEVDFELMQFSNRLSPKTGPAGMWELLFSIESAPSNHSFHNSELSNTDIINVGDAYRVFSTVLAIIKDFVKQYSKLVKSIRFEASFHEPSRIKLYDLIIKKIHTYIPGWTGKQLQGNTQYREYIIIRDKLNSTKDNQNANSNSGSDEEPTTS